QCGLLRQTRETDGHHRQAQCQQSEIRRPAHRGREVNAVTAGGSSVSMRRDVYADRSWALSIKRMVRKASRASVVRDVAVLLSAVVQAGSLILYEIGPS